MYLGGCVSDVGCVFWWVGLRCLWGGGCFGGWGCSVSGVGGVFWWVGLQC